MTRARLDDDLAGRTSAAWSLCAWCSLAVALRQNGVLLVSGLTLVLWIVLRDQRRQLAAVFAIPLLVLAALKLVVYPALGVESSGSQPALAIQLHDIASAVARDPGEFDASERAFLETMGPFDVWASTYDVVHVFVGELGVRPSVQVVGGRRALDAGDGVVAQGRSHASGDAGAQPVVRGCRGIPTGQRGRSLHGEPRHRPEQ